MSQSRLRQTVLPLDPDEFGVDQAGYTDIPGSPPLFDPPSSKRSHRDASTLWWMNLDLWEMNSELTLYLVFSRAHGLSYLASSLYFHSSSLLCLL